MKKIIFLTLVMILGMSSVSFGKTYFCTSDLGVHFIYGVDDWSVINMEGKWVVKTEGNDERIESIKDFDHDSYSCKDGTDVMNKDFKGKIRHGKGKSVKGKTILSCRLMYLQSYGGHIRFEFIWT